MKSALHALLAQFNPTVGAIEHNAEKIIQIIEKNQNHADLIIFPELALTGYPPEDLLFRAELYERVELALDNIKDRVKNTHVILGHPSFENKKFYNSATLLNNAKVLTRYHKQILPNYGVFDEKRYFSQGERFPCIFELQGHVFGICICEDIWHSKPIDQILGAGAQTIICINASPFDLGKYSLRIDTLKKHAQRGLSILYCNQIGGQDELVFDGCSLAMNNQGEICALAPAFKEENLKVTIQKDKLTGSISPLIDKEPLLYSALVCGLKNYVEKNYFPGVIVGLSGGIDSALTLAIAVDALGAEKVHAVTMPSRYTAEMSIEDAHWQIAAMKIKHTNLPIEPIFQNFLTTLAPAFEGLSADTTEENLQARIRGMLLMALSNKTGKMVLTTSNKSESAVGYATLYGDMAGGFSVLKDVFKTEVYELANYRNSLSAVIPQRVITRAPSAELAPNQTDQDTLPPYSILDEIIFLYMEKNLGGAEIIARGFAPSLVDKVIKLMIKNEYKRKQSAPGVKVSACAFGRDWRYPLTSGFYLPIAK